MLIKVDHINKNFKDAKALKDINFTVDKGELFGLIGPDGAGKTTLFRLFTTLLLPDSGKIEIDGLDVVKNYKSIRKEVGYMPGRFSLYQDLSVEENLQFFATIFNSNIEENYDLIAPIYSQIEKFKTRKAGALSGGMKQKLALSCALIHKPKVLFLDEPTTGVDVVSRKEFWEMLAGLKAKGITILVSTPYMDEAALCERVALIQKGEIMSISTPDEIVKAFPHQLYAIRSNDISKLIHDLLDYPSQQSVYPFGQYIHYTDQQKNFDPEALKTFLMDKQHQQLDIMHITPNIEDCFMELMNHPLKTSQL